MFVEFSNGKWIITETTADVKLPTRIVIELRPRNNESWCHVQSLAMNPRVRTSLPLQQQLISLVLYLQRKWQSPDVETVSFIKTQKSASLLACKLSFRILFRMHFFPSDVLNMLYRKRREILLVEKVMVLMDDYQLIFHVYYG